MGILVKSGGVWKDIDPYARDSGAWKIADEGWIKDGGIWKQFFANTSEVTEPLTTGTWVCPAGVTNILTAVGRGAAGSGQTWSGTTTVLIVLVAPSYTFAQSSSTFEGMAQREYNKFSGIGYGASVTFTRNQFSTYGGQNTISGYFRVASGSVSKAGNGWGATYTTPILVSRDYRVGNIQQLIRNITRGPSTTGFGKDFPGGYGGAATTRTYTDIAVTPGVSYPIRVASGGSLVITYLQ